MNNTIKDSTNKNIDLGVDKMAKAIKDFYEFMHLDKPISTQKDGDYNGILKGLFS